MTDADHIITDEDIKAVKQDREFFRFSNTAKAEFITKKIFEWLIDQSTEQRVDEILQSLIGRDIRE